MITHKTGWKPVSAWTDLDGSRNVCVCMATFCRDRSGGIQTHLEQYRDSMGRVLYTAHYVSMRVRPGVCTYVKPRPDL